MLLFITGLVTNFFGWYCDFAESRTKLWYGKKEGNALFRGKDGQMVAWKTILIFLLVEIGGAVAIYFLVPDHNALSAFCWSLVMGAGHFIIARRNIGRSKKNRIAQKELRVQLQNYTDQPAEILAESALLRKVTIRQNKMFLALIPWITGTTRFALAVNLIEWAKLTDETAIWHDLKYE